MKFALPILTADGREFADAKALDEVLSTEKSGHYLLGNHRKWHGGIHISDECAPWCRDKHPVRAMADGKVVAFRMLEEYLVSEFQGESLRYSNCFCLIEHAYCEINPDTQAKNEFTFYSLYMHLKPWQPEQDGERLVLKKRWNVRNSVPHHHPDAEQQQADAQLPKVPLPARTELEPVAGCEPEWGTVDGKDYRFIKVSIKSALPREVLAAGEQAGVLLNQGSQVWVAEDEAALERITPPQPLWLFDQIEAELTHDMVGHADPQFNGPTGRVMIGGHNTSLPSGTLIEYDAHQLEFHWQGDKVRKMARCRYRTPSQGRLSGRCGVTWVCVEESNIRIKRQTPSHLNQLYVLPSPVAIAAGETVGFLGLMESPGSLLGGKQSKHQVHLELFTQDPRLDAVLANQANTAGGTRYARVPAGLALYQKRNNQWVDSGQQSEATLLTAPAEEKSGDKQWLCVKEGAYVHKEQAEMLSQHDWLKLGFKKVDGSGSDGYLDPQQAPAFFQELVYCLDTNQDGHLSGEEITAALCNLEPLLHSPQSRSRLQKLIVRHPSEWYDKSAGASHQWLDMLKAQVARPEFDQLVAHEKQRIDQLEWMQSATSLKLNRNIWHFWPLGMQENTAFHPKALIVNELVEIEFLDFYNNDIINDDDYLEAASELSCEARAIKAVALTETGNTGSYYKFTDHDDAVPSILFERHKFSRLTNGRYDNSHPEISNPINGGYGQYREQYRKLMTAYSLDKEAALKSASWGKFQILGLNHSSAGFANVMDFVRSLSKSEKFHLKAFVSFIKSDTHLLNAIRNKDWTAFAIGYNGPRQIGYDSRMRDNYNAQ